MLPVVTRRFAFGALMLLRAKKKKKSGIKFLGGFPMALFKNFFFWRPKSPQKLHCLCASSRRSLPLPVCDIFLRSFFCLFFCSLTPTTPPVRTIVWCFIFVIKCGNRMWDSCVIQVVSHLTHLDAFFYYEGREGWGDIQFSYSCSFSHFFFNLKNYCSQFLSMITTVVVVPFSK